MAESDEVAPLKAEENSNLVSLASEIAEAAGVESFIVNASETEAETEVEEEAIEEEIPEEPEPEPTGDSDGVKKRIGKLIDARNKAEEERDALKAQLEDLQTKDNPRQSYKEEGMQKFEEVRTYDELDQREQDAEHLRDWLLENPDGGDYTDLSGEEHEVEYEAARQLMVATDRDLRKNIPAVKQRLQLRQQNEDIALKTFPWMNDRESSQHVKMVRLLEENKELGSYFKKDPAAMITLGFIMDGMTSLQNSKKPSQPASAPQVPSAPTRATTSVVKKKVGKDKGSLLEQARSGEVSDAASYIESLL